MLHIFVAVAFIGMGIVLNVGWGHIPMVGTFSMAMVVGGAIAILLGVQE